MKDLAPLLEPGAAAIFLFHGVVPEPTRGVRNYTGKHLPLADFERYLDALLDAGTPVTVADVACGDYPDSAFAVTFDDGFANNLTIAAPAMRDRDVPASVYVTTTFVAEDGASWIDRIEFAVSRAYADKPRADAIALLDELRRRGKSPRVDPYALAEEVFAEHGIEQFEPDPLLDRKLTWDELRELSADPLFTVGGHGVTHRILEHLDDAELEREVADGLAALRTQLDEAVVEFSYPEGVAGCFSPRVVDAVRRHGIRIGLTAVPGVNRRGDDPYLLRRFLVA